jgi:AAA15 family ATPase/GTPase
MLTRIYIDNFRCFVNFEYKPDRKQLVIGKNGSGKSSFLDAWLWVRGFAARGVQSFGVSLMNQRTRWMRQSQQTFEFEAVLDNKTFTYHLTLDMWGDPPAPRIVAETVYADKRPLFEFVSGEVRLYNEQSEQKTSYPFDWHRSAFATIIPSTDNHALKRFAKWFDSSFGFRINPFKMHARAESEATTPYASLSDFASWYRHLVQAHPKQNASLLDSLRSVLDDFSFLELESVGQNIRVLLCEFAHLNEPPIKFTFNELSEGQKCLIALYAVLHFVLAMGNTVIFDEPENFLSLHEIQPWLNAVSDLVDEGKGQVVIISHHPEFMNQWASSFGVRFVREGVGPVRVKEFSGEGYSTLLPSEIIARGWENE